MPCAVCSEQKKLKMFLQVKKGCDNQKLILTRQIACQDGSQKSRLKELSTPLSVYIGVNGWFNTQVSKTKD